MNKKILLPILLISINSALFAQQASKYRQLIEDIRKKENILIGNQAPDFKAIDLNQQIVTLSQFKRKSIVLLEK